MNRLKIKKPWFKIRTRLLLNSCLYILRKP